MKEGKNTKITLFWFPRDLRLEDNIGLFEAINVQLPVQPVFIFDTNILDKLADRNDARVSFIHQEVLRIANEIQMENGSLDVRYGDPEQIWPTLLADYNIDAVYTNGDYEPYAIAQDEKVEGLLSDKGIPFHSFKDHVIFEKDEVVKADGLPYTVYTPYSKLWKAKLSKSDLLSSISESLDNWNSTETKKNPDLQDLGFGKSSIGFSKKRG